MSLKNKTVLITGATGGLGRIVTREFLKAGAKVGAVYIIDKEWETYKTTMNGDKSNLTGIKADVLTDAGVKSMVEAMINAFGRIDIVVNLVGGFSGGIPVTETAEADWDKMMNLNLKTVFLSCKNIMPVMVRQKSGRIINISSRAGLQGAANYSAYAASKAALINFTQTIADEGRPQNITANAILPSIIDTPANRKAMPDANFKDWATPEAIADAILFLSSNAASEISGASIPVYNKA
ncbi:MAG: SDR family oxidoreductase [Calditrichaceae bacterium]